MDTNKVFQSKLFGIIILSVVGVGLLAFIFGLGVFVGTRRAEFSFRWADQYHQNFGDSYTNGNGVFGQIIKITDIELTVKGRDNVEKIILVNDKTPILLQKNNIKLSDLKVGDNVIIIGDPTDKGQIQAELIRIMPAKPGIN